MPIKSKQITLYIAIHNLNVTFMSHNKFQCNPTNVSGEDDTVNSEFFMRILFSRKALKDIFVMLEICN